MQSSVQTDDSIPTIEVMVTHNSEKILISEEMNLAVIFSVRQARDVESAMQMMLHVKVCMLLKLMGQM